VPLFTFTFNGFWKSKLWISTSFVTSLVQSPAGEQNSCRAFCSILLYHTTPELEETSPTLESDDCRPSVQSQFLMNYLSCLPTKTTRPIFESNGLQAASLHWQVLTWNSSADKKANVNFLRRHRTQTTKYKKRKTNS